MTLSAFTDGNRFLDRDKLTFADAPAYANDVKSADRLVKAALFEMFGTVVNTWDIAPGVGQIATPEIVVDISAMLAASYYYRRIYSEETTNVPYYADQLEKRAMDLLDKLRSGAIGLDDELYVSTTAMSADNFWPNDTTIDLCGNPVRLFTMQDIF